MRSLHYLLALVLGMCLELKGQHHHGGTMPVPEFAETLYWSDPETWRLPGFEVTGPCATTGAEQCFCPATVPRAGKSVVIPAGARVILDVDTPVLDGVMIHGELIFADQPAVGLSAHWIMIMGMGSALRIGTEAEPYQHDTHVTLYGTDIAANISGEPAPWTSGNKFIMPMDGGTLALHGASRAKTSWTKLAANAQPGDTHIFVEDAATGWQVGDRLAIGPSGYFIEDATDIVVTAIAGNRIDFTPALHAEHWGQLMEVDGVMIDQRAPVGLLTRNIKIRGADDSLLPRSDVPGFPGYGIYTNLSLDAPLNFGVHIMVMGGLAGRPKAYAYIEGVEFTRSGQMSLQGRYTFHWHWVGDAEGQYFRNNSVHHAFQRAVNIHRTGGVEVSDNVAYKVSNHNYVWAEDGHETELNNRFLRNLAIAVPVQSHTIHPMAFGNRGTQPDRVGTGLDPVKQEEWRASGFWGRNFPHTLEGNHVAGVIAGMGYFFDVGGGSKPEPNMHLFSFNNNTVHSASDTVSGLALNNDLYPPAVVGNGLFVRNRNAGPVEFRGLHVFKSKVGVWLENQTQTVRDSIFSDNAGAVMLFQGRVEDSLIVGITDNPIGRDHPLVRGRSPRSINTLGALSSGIFIFGGQGGQKTLKASNVTVVNAPGGALASSDIYTYHGSYFTGLRVLDSATPPVRMVGLGEGAWLDVDGLMDPAGQGRPTWLTFSDPHYITRDSRYDARADAWRTPDNGHIVRFDHPLKTGFGPLHTRAEPIEHGLGVILHGPGGVAIPVDYVVTPNTVIEFSAMHDQLYGQKNWSYVGIGLVESPGMLTEPRIFGIHGDRLPPFAGYARAETQQWLKPQGGISPPGVSYRIPIGQYYTGAMSHLAIYGRGDGNPGENARFWIQLVRIYEQDQNQFRGWPVVRRVYEGIATEIADDLRFADLIRHPGFPHAPEEISRVAPYYGSGVIHSYGKRELHSSVIQRQRMNAAMVEDSFLVVDETGLYTFSLVTGMTNVRLQLAEANGGPAQWFTVVERDQGRLTPRGVHEVTGTIYLKAGTVYHWRHTVLHSFNVAPDPHNIHWLKPGDVEFSHFDTSYLRPLPGPLAGDEPPGTSYVANSSGDGVPDWWKLMHGFDPFVDDDSNHIPGSDLTLAEAFAFGLNPNVTTSRPVLLPEQLAPGQMQLSFPGAPGRRYQLMLSTDLLSWQPWGGAVTANNNSEWLHWQAPAPGQQPVFYRLSVSVDDALSQPTAIPGAIQSILSLGD